MSGGLTAAARSNFVSSLTRRDAEAVIESFITRIREIAVHHNIPVIGAARYSEFKTVSGLQHRTSIYADVDDFHFFLMQLKEQIPVLEAGGPGVVAGKDSSAEVPV